MATCGNTTLNAQPLCKFLNHTQNFEHTNLQLLHVNSSGSVRVEKIESFLNFLPLLVRQFNLGSSLLPLAGRENCFTVARSLRSSTWRGCKSSLHIGGCVS